MNQGLMNSYYQIKPYIPRSLQIMIRSRVTLLKKWVYRNTWPIDREAAKIPEAWSGWPEESHFALVLTHDVDTVTGQEKCGELAEIEKCLGFRSSFNFVITNKVSHELRNRLEKDGFEVGIHGLWHDRSLYESKGNFDYQAEIINTYLKKWGSVGFRSPSMHHNLEWLHGLDIAYDASTFDTDPFEPQPDGVGTIFPFWVPANHGDNNKGYVELPYTLPQDFTLFVLFKEKTIDVWKRKLDWIFEHGGMALVNTHPDYMNFTNKANNFSSYSIDYYIEFLEYIKTCYGNCCWHVLPRDLARFWIEWSHEEGRERQ